MPKNMNFTVIRSSGRTEFFHDSSYFLVLSSVAHEYGSAGGNWDRPNMLLLNGKVVVAEGLADIAWEYGQRSRKLHDELNKKLNDEFTQEWLTAALKGDNDAT